MRNVELWATTAGTMMRAAMLAVSIAALTLAEDGVDALQAAGVIGV